MDHFADVSKMIKIGKGGNREVDAVYHRLNDNEDKWIVSLNGETIPEEKILEAICFQEQYFMGELYTL